MRRLTVFAICLLLPSLLMSKSVRTLVFSDMLWGVKASDTPVAPGPNVYSDSPRSVWVDENGLHLTIKKSGGRWMASEVYTLEPTGYGTYTFTVGTPIHRYEPQVVAGFFTWDMNPELYNREIDIEFAAWGELDGTKMQYVVQPYTNKERLFVFDPLLQGSVTTHRIIWSPEGVWFSSYHGTVDPDDTSSDAMRIQNWHYPESPSEGNAHFRINLWLFRGTPLHQEIQLSVTSFSFVPLP